MWWLGVWSLRCLSSVRCGGLCLRCVSAARRGGRCPVWAHDVAVSASLRLRCGARPTRAAAVPLVSALNAPHFTAPRRSGADGAGLPLAGLRSSPRHKSPTPGTAHRAEPVGLFDDACRGGGCKAAGGCAPAATYAAPSSAERMAARAQRAQRVLTRRDCLSVANEVSAASFATGHAIEQRREPLAQRGAAAFERRRIPARGFASSVIARNRGHVLVNRFAPRGPSR